MGQFLGGFHVILTAQSAEAKDGVSVAYFTSTLLAEEHHCQWALQLRHNLSD